jgi:hypothetical protein
LLTLSLTETFLFVVMSRQTLRGMREGNDHQRNVMFPWVSFGQKGENILFQKTHLFLDSFGFLLQSALFTRLTDNVFTFPRVPRFEDCSFRKNQSTLNIILAVRRGHNCERTLCFTIQRKKFTHMCRRYSSFSGMQTTDSLSIGNKKLHVVALTVSYLLSLWLDSLPWRWYCWWGRLSFVRSMEEEMEWQVCQRISHEIREWRWPTMHQFWTQSPNGSRLSSSLSLSLKSDFLWPVMSILIFSLEFND